MIWQLKDQDPRILLRNVIAHQTIDKKISDMQEESVVTTCKFRPFKLIYIQSLIGHVEILYIIRVYYRVSSNLVEIKYETSAY